MFARIKRIFRSFIGAFINLAEDPKLILQQNIRDMQDKVPEMNTGIAKAKGGVLHLEQEIDTYKKEIAATTARVKACLLGGDEALAGQYAMQLKQKQEALEHSTAQHQQAQAGYEALLKLKERYMREMKLKTEEAMQAIKESDAAKWKSELADCFTAFEVAGVDQTHNDMIEKLKERSTLADGKIAAAVEGIDMKGIAMEEKAQALEGQELLKQFKLDLGMSTPASSSPVLTEEKKVEAPTKVIG